MSSDREILVWNEDELEPPATDVQAQFLGFLCNFTRIAFGQSIARTQLFLRNYIQKTDPTITIQRKHQYKIIPGQFLDEAQFLQINIQM